VLDLALVRPSVKVAAVVARRNTLTWKSCKEKQKNEAFGYIYIEREREAEIFEFRIFRGLYGAWIVL